MYVIFTKALWSRYPFTASSTIVSIDNLVVTSTTPTITPSMCLPSLESSEATLSNHCLQFLHSSTYLKLICRADGFTRHQHPLWCDFPPIIPRTLPLFLRLAQSVQCLFARHRLLSQPIVFSPSSQTICLSLVPIAKSFRHLMLNKRRTRNFRAC
ncbi:hypothetical protein BDR22DRAFT_564459 [Usnea florida]